MKIKKLDTNKQKMGFATYRQPYFTKLFVN